MKISNNAIRVIMRTKTKRQISVSGIVLVAQYIEDHIAIITELAEKELKEFNDNPNCSREYKRLNGLIIQKVLGRIKEEGYS